MKRKNSKSMPDNDDGTAESESDVDINDMIATHAREWINGLDRDVVNYRVTSPPRVGAKVKVN